MAKIMHSISIQILPTPQKKDEALPHFAFSKIGLFTDRVCSIPFRFRPTQSNHAAWDQWSMPQNPRPLDPLGEELFLFLGPLRSFSFRWEMHVVIERKQGHLKNPGLVRVAGNKDLVFLFVHRRGDALFVCHDNSTLRFAGPTTIIFVGRLMTLDTTRLDQRINLFFKINLVVRLQRPGTEEASR